MNPWDIYASKIGAQGYSKRDVVKNREIRFLHDKLKSSLSYHKVTIESDPRELAIINSDNLNIKTICTLPGEDIHCGTFVEWADNVWLITAKDANNELYTKGTMQQCNHLLRWVANGNEIIERWCIVEDGTKYLTGEYNDNNYVVTRGDSRISITLPRDEYTIQLNRDSRFLIDDPETNDVLAYRLTKPFRLGWTFNGEGVMVFVLTECNTEDTDNFDLRIANYYDYFPRDDSSGSSDSSTGASTGDTIKEQGNSTGKKVWL